MRMMYPSMAKTPDGRIMVMARSSEVFLWRAVAPEQMIPVLPPARSVLDLAPTVGGGPRRGPGADAPPPQFRAVTIAPRGDRIYMIEQGVGPTGVLRAWSIASSSDSTHLQARDLGWSVPMAEGATSLALRPDGAMLAVADRTGTVTLLETARSKILGQIRPPSGEAESFWHAMAFSPDGRDLALGSAQGGISLWSVAQPAHPRLRLHLPGHRGLVTNLVFDPHGRRLASAGFADPLVEVWDLDFIERELARWGLADGS
jgi:WD40 repeat protein